MKRKKRNEPQFISSRPVLQGGEMDRSGGTPDVLPFRIADNLTYDECLFYYGDLLGKRKWEEQQKRKNDDTR